MSLIYFLGQFLHPFSDVKLIWLGESTIFLILLYKGNALVFSLLSIGSFHIYNEHICIGKCSYQN